MMVVWSGINIGDAGENMRAKCVWKCKIMRVS